MTENSARHRRRAALVAAAGVGSADPRSALAVLADYLQEGGDPLGLALAAALADPDLAPLGVETFSCPNDTEGERRFTVPVFVFLPFARAIGLAPSERATDTELVLLPPPGETGAYRMGGDYLGDPAHEAPFGDVTVAPYLIARTVLSQRVYRAAISDRVVEHVECIRGGNGYADAPVWTMPLDPVWWLPRSTAERACLERGLRLPTEAEWEHAGRGGTRTRFCIGERVDPDLVRCDSRDVDGLLRTAVPIDAVVAVAEGRMNAYGLFGVHGNVGQWVSDEDAALATKRWHTGGSSVGSCGGHDGAILRGGGVRCSAAQCASAARVTGDALDSTGYATVRVALTPRAERFLADLERALADSDPKARANAANEIGRRALAGGVAALRRALDDADPRVRGCASDALVALGPQAVPALVEYAQDPERPGHREAVEALSRSPTARDAEAVTVFRAVSGGWESMHAVRGLMQLGAAGEAALIERLSDPDGFERQCAAEALGHLRSPNAIAALVRLLDDPPDEHGIRPTAWAAAEALAAIWCGLPPTNWLPRPPWPAVPEPRATTAEERCAIRDALFDHVETGPEWYRLVGTIAEAGINPDAVVDRACRAVRRRDWTAVDHWLEAIEQAELPAASSELRDAIAQLEDAECVALVGAVRVESPARCESLWRLMESRGAAARAAAIAVIVQRAISCRGRQLPALEAAFADSDREVRARAAVGLASLGVASAAISDGIADALAEGDAWLGYRPRTVWPDVPPPTPIDAVSSDGALELTSPPGDGDGPGLLDDLPLREPCAPDDDEPPGPSWLMDVQWNRGPLHPTPRLIEVLRLRATEPWAACALAAIGPAARPAAPALLDVATRRPDDFELLAGVARALGSIGAIEAVGWLEAMLESPDEKLRVAACGALVGLGVAGRCGPVMVEVARRGRIGYDRAAASDLLEHYTPDAATAAALVALLREPDSNKAAYAVARCVARGGPEAVAALADLAASGQWARVPALRALVHLELLPAALLDVARSWLAAENKYGRRAGAEALVMAGVGDDLDVLPLLLPSEGREDWLGDDVGRQPRPTAALARLGPRALSAVPRLLDWLRYGDTGACLAALLAIGPAAGAMARPVLAAMVADPDTSADVAEAIEAALPLIVALAEREARAPA